MKKNNSSQHSRLSFHRHRNRLRQQQVDSIRKDQRIQNLKYSQGQIYEFRSRSRLSKVSRSV